MEHTFDALIVLMNSNAMMIYFMWHIIYIWMLCELYHFKTVLAIFVSFVRAIADIFQTMLILFPKFLFISIEQFLIIFLNHLPPDFTSRRLLCIPW